jgi:two-component system, NarL family, captular synthesis response regulator RcsB
MMIPSRIYEIRDRAMNQEAPCRIRVALLDDHPVVIHGLSAQLRPVPDVSVVGEFENSRDLLTFLSTKYIDVLLMDYSLSPKEIDGVSLLRNLRTRFPELEILVISGHSNAATASLAIRAGARGFVGKTRPITDVVEAIRTVAAGRRYVDQTIVYDFDQAEAEAAAAGVQESSSMPLANKSAISARELEVLRCVLDGMSVSMIAKKFSRSVNTISTQKQSAYRKLGIRSDAELFKVQHSLLNGEEWAEY